MYDLRSRANAGGLRLLKSRAGERYGLIDPNDRARVVCGSGGSAGVYTATRAEIASYFHHARHG